MPLPSRTKPVRTPDPRPDTLGPSPTERVGLDDATQAFLEADRVRSAELESNPVMLFLERHEEAGSPNELIITGVADVKVTIGDLRRLVRAIK